MAVHYEAVMEKYGMCPTSVAIGFKNTGKSTAARTALALLGTPQYFIREFTAAQRCAWLPKDLLTVFYDPDDLYSQGEVPYRQLIQSWGLHYLMIRHQSQQVYWLNHTQFGPDESIMQQL